MSISMELSTKYVFQLHIDVIYLRTCPSELAQARRQRNTQLNIPKRTVS